MTHPTWGDVLIALLTGMGLGLAVASNLMLRNVGRYGREIGGRR